MFTPILMTEESIMSLEEPKFAMKFLEWMTDRLMEILRARLELHGDKLTMELFDNLLLILLVENIILEKHGRLPKLTNESLTDTVARASHMIDPWGAELD